LQGPVYYPFYDVIKENGCHVLNNTLKFKDEKYIMDYVDLENKFTPEKSLFPKPPQVKAAILCNPHNPVGRMWTKEEQTKFGEIVLKHRGIVISDEIHSEIVLSNRKHIPFASISKEFEQNSITCMSPSKTFNIAGLSVSSIIIPNENLRNAFISAAGHLLGKVSVLSLVAMEAAYRYGDEWLNELLKYLKSNLKFLMQYFKNNIPQVKVIVPEGTYLVWLDFRSLGMNETELSEFLIEKAKVGLDDGYLFGPSGAGFARINIACPKSTLEEGLKRIEKAVKDYNKTQ
jgi:cystathionine beta-lyase